MIISVSSKLKSTARQAAERIESVSKTPSPLQQEYLNLLQGMLVEKDLDNPFDQPSDKISEFFKEVSSRWEKRKAELNE